MSLYTIILDYAGGTYISQVQSMDESQALLEWTKTSDIKGLHANTAKALTKHFCTKLSDEPPVAVQALVNIWCATALVADKLAIINIIKTEP